MKYETHNRFPLPSSSKIAVRSEFQLGTRCGAVQTIILVTIAMLAVGAGISWRFFSRRQPMVIDQTQVSLNQQLQQNGSLSSPPAQPPVAPASQTQPGSIKIGPVRDYVRSGDGSSFFYTVSKTVRMRRTYTQNSSLCPSPERNEEVHIEHAVVVNDDIGDFYDSISNITFVPNANTVAFIAGKFNRARGALDYFVVVGGKEGKRYELIYERFDSWAGKDASQKPLLFTPSGESVYLARRGELCNPTGDMLIVGKGEGALKSQILSFSVNPRSGTVAYVSNAIKQSVVVNGVPGPEYDSIENLTTYPQRSEVLYVAQFPGSQNVGSGITPASEMALIAQDARGAVREGKRYGKIWSLAMSPDGKRTAFLAAEAAHVVSNQYGGGTLVQGKRYLVIDGKEREFTYGADCLTWSSDSAKLAYVELRDTATFQQVFLQERDSLAGTLVAVVEEGDVIRRGKAYAYRDFYNSGGCRTFAFTPDGADVVYQVGRNMFVLRGMEIVPKQTVLGGQWIDANGVTHPNLAPDEFRGDSFVISPDGHTIAYVVASSRLGVAVSVNGEEGERYPNIVFNTLRFSADGTRLSYFAHVFNDENQCALLLETPSGLMRIPSEQEGCVAEVWQITEKIE